MGTYGMRVKHTNEDGGMVRGVCGSEEKTPIAYIPIGMGGCSGLLRVQIVPGPVPCLLPAYLLTDMGSVIDMVGLNMFHTSLGVAQRMHRRDAGHVEVSITEFGKGFSMPNTASFGRSQVWSERPPPKPIRYLDAFDMRLSLEAILLALAIGGLDASHQLVVAGGPAAGASGRPALGCSEGAPGEACWTCSRRRPSSWKLRGNQPQPRARRSQCFETKLGRTGQWCSTSAEASIWHPCNRDWAWTKCSECGAIEQIPKLTPDRVTEWNTVLVRQAPNYKTLQSIKEEKAAKKAAKSTGMSSTTPTATAAAASSARPARTSTPPTTRRTPSTTVHGATDNKHNTELPKKIGGSSGGPELPRTDGATNCHGDPQASSSTSSRRAASQDGHGRGRVQHRDSGQPSFPTANVGGRLGVRPRLGPSHLGRAHAGICSDQVLRSVSDRGADAQLARDSEGISMALCSGRPRLPFHLERPGPQRHHDCFRGQTLPELPAGGPSTTQVAGPHGLQTLMSEWDDVMGAFLRSGGYNPDRTHSWMESGNPSAA